MEILELVQSAAFKSGLVSSFNPSELPGDIQEAGRATLVNEILPMLNCDRTLDITVTARVYQPVDGSIILRPYTAKHNEMFIGYSTKYTAKEMGTDFDKFWDAVGDLRPDYHNRWPEDDLGNRKTLLIWGKDIQLAGGVSLENSDECWYNSHYNIDFPPMRVESVLDDASRVKYEYLYREEFERVLIDAMPYVFTTEEYEDCIKVLFKGNGEPKRLTLPVPLQVINSDIDHCGTIIAPPKFKRYLIDATAVSLAIIYGLSTVDAMRQQAEQSYQMLKKNKPQPLHKAQPAEEIGNVLRHVTGGRRFYGGF